MIPVPSIARDILSALPLLASDRVIIGVDASGSFLPGEGELRCSVVPGQNADVLTGHLNAPKQPAGWLVRVAGNPERLSRPFEK